MKNLLLPILALSALLLSTSCALFKNNPVKNRPEMVFVEGGTFEMGDIFEHSNNDALPVHKVKLEDFYIGKFEVTLAQYDEYAMVRNLETLYDDERGRATRAANRVTWDEADAYCRYFGWRLPTEEEWEYAARARGQKFKYAGTNDKDSLRFYAIINDTDIPYAFYVGSREPNPLGLYDMSGNVFEWIGAYYQFYEEPDKMHNMDDGVRIIRGGSFNEQVSTTRTYWRTGTLRDVRANDIGFRCAVSADDY